jgi:hypothetical protein
MRRTAGSGDPTAPLANSGSEPETFERRLNQVQIPEFVGRHDLDARDAGDRGGALQFLHHAQVLAVFAEPVAQLAKKGTDQSLFHNGFEFQG